MTETYQYLALSGVLTVLLWTPYIVARLFTWGLGGFLKNYAGNFPQDSPEQPLWAARAQRSHLNMVETMPAFIAVVVAASLLTNGTLAAANTWAAVFFYARVAHAVVYLTGVPYLRTPVYLVSWFAILSIAYLTLNQA